MACGSTSGAVSTGSLVSLPRLSQNEVGPFSLINACDFCTSLKAARETMVVGIVSL